MLEVNPIPYFSLLCCQETDDTDSDKIFPADMYEGKYVLCLTQLCCHPTCCVGTN